MREHLTSIKISEIEKKLGKKLRKRTKVLGLDTASKTGYAILETTDKYMTIDVGIIAVKSKDMYFKYDRIIDYLKKLINDNKYRIIIEDTFFSRNAKTLKMLTRIGAFGYLLAKEIGCKNIRFIMASLARKTVGFKGNAKKIELVDKVNKLLGTELKTHDITDAIILALNGLIKE